MGTRGRGFTTDGRRCAKMVVSVTTRITSTCVGLERLRRRLRIIGGGYTSRRRMLGVARMQCGAKLITGLSITRTGSILCDAGTSVPRLRTNVGRCVAVLTILLKVCPRSVHPMLRPIKVLPSCVRPVNIKVPISLLVEHPSIQDTRQDMGTRTTLLKTSGTS